MPQKKKVGRKPKGDDKFVVESWSMPPEVPPIVKEYAHERGLSRSAAAAELIKVGIKFWKRRKRAHQ